MSDPESPHRGWDRVIRGGSLDFGASACRAAARGGFPPGYRPTYLSYRLARTVR